MTLAPVHDDATIDEAVAALARELGGYLIAADAGLGSVPLEVRVTRRWRGVDSKIQFRDASPPAKQRGHIYFGGEWRLFGPPKQLYRFAEADDHSDDSAAPTVDRPQPDRSLETARDGEGEEG